MYLTALYFLFIAIVFIQLCYFLLFSKFVFAKRDDLAINDNPISIIICARNEAENLRTNLKIILEQDYDTFEVIVVDDASNDSTFAVLMKFREKYQHLKVIKLELTKNYQGNKKNAITKGVEAATHETLLFTDADCKPASPHWITEISSNFIDHKQIVLGYGAHRKIANSYLNKVLRFETLITAIQYFSYAKIGLPYMGVGRNLAYKKALFYQANGLEDHKHLKSGDDDLLINQVATQKNTAICFSKRSFTISEPKRTYKSWFYQKRRHISTASYYKPIHQFMLGTYYISQFLFWFLAILLLAFTFKWQLVILLVLIRLIVHYIIFGKAAKKLDEKDLILPFPILDMTLAIIQLGMYLNNLITKPKSW